MDRFQDISIKITTKVLWLFLLKLKPKSKSLDWTYYNILYLQTNFFRNHSSETYLEQNQKLIKKHCTNGFDSKFVVENTD